MPTSRTTSAARIDSEAAQKAARFVRTCNAFGIPLVVLVDAPGFLPGSRQEANGVIRHGAKLLHAFAEATVPRVTVVLRKAFGGAYITMNSRDLGADLAFAWPHAEIGVMGAGQAVGVISRREIAAADDPDATRAALAGEYAAEHLSASIAAREGFIDEVIEPIETRARLAWALSRPRAREECSERWQHPALSPAWCAATSRSATASPQARPEASPRAAGPTSSPRRCARPTRSSSTTTSAQVGATTAEVAGTQLAPCLKLQPDLITVVSGANDVLLSVRPDIEAHAVALEFIFSRIRQRLPGAALMTATTPQVADHIGLRPRSRKRVEEGLTALNDATREVALRHEVVCLEFARPPGRERALQLRRRRLPSLRRGHPPRGQGGGGGARHALRYPDKPQGDGMTDPFAQDFDALEGGERFVTRGRTITEADVVSFATLTGDFHPQHVDASWAVSSRFGERIAHGMLVMSYAIGLVPLDPERVVALRRVSDVVFKNPVYIGDTIHVEGRIESVLPRSTTTTGSWRASGRSSRSASARRSAPAWRSSAAVRRSRPPSSLPSS